MRPYRWADAEAELAACLRDGDLAGATRAAQALDRMEQPAPASIVGAALWYARVGLPVFPLAPGSKIPLRGTRGVLDATTDPAEVRRLFGQASNIGLATGYGVDVLDFDGWEAHAAWGRAYCVDPEDPEGEQHLGRGPSASWAGCELTVLATVSTPRPGGLHVYVPSTGMGNRAGYLDHVDYRGLGGYVVAPPSRTELGTYRFASSLNPEDLTHASA
jgi:hypothetical protein